MFLELAASIPTDFLISKDNAVLALKRHTLEFKILTPGEAAAFLLRTGHASHLRMIWPLRKHLRPG